MRMMRRIAGSTHSTDAQLAGSWHVKLWCLKRVLGNSKVTLVFPTTLKIKWAENRRQEENNYILGAQLTNAFLWYHAHLLASPAFHPFLLSSSPPSCPIQEWRKLGVRPQRQTSVPCTANRTGRFYKFTPEGKCSLRVSKQNKTLLCFHQSVTAHHCLFYRGLFSL